MDALEGLLATIDPREEEAVVLYFGLRGSPPISMRRVGERLSGRPVTASRVSQIIRHAIRRIRHPSRRKLLEAYLKATEGVECFAENVR